jgi:hypothetical protein
VRIIVSISVLRTASETATFASDQIAAREKRERDTEAAFIVIQDEIPAYPPHCRSMLEQLCVENLHVPEIWLPEVRWMLERIAKAARIPGTEGGEGGPA